MTIYARKPVWYFPVRIFFAIVVLWHRYFLLGNCPGNTCRRRWWWQNWFNWSRGFWRSWCCFYGPSVPRECCVSTWRSWTWVSNQIEMGFLVENWPLEYSDFATGDCNSIVTHLRSKLKNNEVLSYLISIEWHFVSSNWALLWRLYSENWNKCLKGLRIANNMLTTFVLF